MPPSQKPISVRKQTALPLLVLALSLTACASKPQVVQVTPDLPSPPALTTPLPQTPYSTNVQALLSRWQKLLTGTSTISEPPATHGLHGTSLPGK